MQTTCSARFRVFLQHFSQLVEGSDEAAILGQGAPLLAELVKQDDWLPDEFARSNRARYQQYLLYCDPQERFSVVSFVWDAGQSTPLHDHRTWGMVGILRGAETSQAFTLEDGRPMPLNVETLHPGDVAAFSPTSGDIHQVMNARPDGASVSIHVYGLNIGRVSRSVYAEDGTEKHFVSNYCNRTLPNFWMD